MKKKKNLNGDTYLEMLENTIQSLIVEKIKNNIKEDLIYFQQDGAPSPHYVLHMGQFLIPTFYWEKRSNRMTGKSPDLTFSTFCF